MSQLAPKGGKKTATSTFASSSGNQDLFNAKAAFDASGAGREQIFRDNPAKQEKEKGGLDKCCTVFLLILLVICVLIGIGAAVLCIIYFNTDPTIKGWKIGGIVLGIIVSTIGVILIVLTIFKQKNKRPWRFKKEKNFFYAQDYRKNPDKDGQINIENFGDEHQTSVESLNNSKAPNNNTTNNGTLNNKYTGSNNNFVAPNNSYTPYNIGNGALNNSYGTANNNKAPVNNNNAPFTGGNAPPTSSYAPATSSNAPLTTSYAPFTSSHAPLTSSYAPVTSSNAPLTTSYAPSNDRTKEPTPVGNERIENQPMMYSLSDATPRQVDLESRSVSLMEPSQIQTVSGAPRQNQFVSQTPRPDLISFPNYPYTTSQTPRQDLISFQTDDDEKANKNRGTFTAFDRPTNFSNGRETQSDIVTDTRRNATESVIVRRVPIPTTKVVAKQPSTKVVIVTVPNVPGQLIMQPKTEVTDVQ